MRPQCIKQVRPDGLAVLCAWCPDFKAGLSWCDARNHSVTTNMCPDCETRETAKVLAEPIPEQRVAPWLKRHDIKTTKDLEAFLNGEIT